MISVYQTKQKLQELFKDSYFKAAFGLFIVGIFLRFYKLYGYVTFLGDQGRDAIILRRILTFEHFPAIGAPTSVGQVYLGPFYYYFIAPWLAIAGFDPIGPAFGVAVFSSIFLIFGYFVGRELFDKKTGFIFTAFLAFSGSLVDLSRYSWNPNLLPLFTLMFFYTFLVALKRDQWKWFFAAGAVLSFCIQLHYIALVLGVPAVMVYLRYIWSKRQELKKSLRNGIVMTSSFLFFSTPLFIFDLRHDFLNSRNFIKLFTESEAVGGSKTEQLLATFTSLNEFVFGIPMNSALTSGLFIGVVCASFILLRKQRYYSQLATFLVFTIIGISLYSGPKYIHYFTIVYPLYFLTISVIFSRLLWSKKLSVFMILFFMVFVWFNIKTMQFFFNPPSNQIAHAKQIAQIMKDNITIKNFQVTGLPDKYSDSTYRYFLELWGLRPIAKDSLEKAEELFVVCQYECKVIGDPQWDIAYFAPNSIVGEWKVGHDTIYKLVR